MHVIDETSQVKDETHPADKGFRVGMEGGYAMFFSWFGKKDRTPMRDPMQALIIDGHEVELPGVGLVHVDRTINCIGDGCPKPQLLTLKALNTVEEGGVVELISDNPTAVETIPSMMLSAYGTHLATVRRDGCWKVYVRRGIS